MVVETTHINGEFEVKEEDITLPVDEEYEKAKIIVEKQERLSELTKDLAQVQAGLVVPNIEEKKQEFQTLLNEIRVLQGKPEREILSIEHTKETKE